MRLFLGFVIVFVGIFVSWVLLAFICDALYAANPKAGSPAYLLMMAIGIVWPVWPAFCIPLIMAGLAYLESRRCAKLARKLKRDNCDG